MHSVTVTVTVLCWGAFVLLGAYPAAAMADESEEEVTLTKQPDTSLCEDRVCPRIYDPVCGSVDDVPMTAPSRCDLNNKIRCAKLLRSMRDLKDAYIPVVRFLHDGPCPAEVDSSTVVRMKRKIQTSEESDDGDAEDDDDDDEDDSNEAGI